MLILTSSCDRPELIEAWAARSFNKQSNTSHRDDVILFPHLYFIHNVGNFSPRRLYTCGWGNSEMLRCGGCLFLGGGPNIYLKECFTHSLTHLARWNFCKLLRSRRFFFQDKCTSLLVEVLDLREMILNSQFVIFIPNSIIALSGKPSQPNQPLLKSQDMVHACLDYTLMPGPFTFGL